MTEAHAYEFCLHSRLMDQNASSLTQSFWVVHSTLCCYMSNQFQFVFLKNGETDSSLKTDVDGELEFSILDRKTLLPY